MDCAQVASSRLPKMPRNVAWNGSGLLDDATATKVAVNGKSSMLVKVLCPCSLGASPFGLEAITSDRSALLGSLCR